MDDYQPHVPSAYIVDAQHTAVFVWYGPLSAISDASVYRAIFMRKHTVKQ